MCLTNCSDCKFYDSSPYHKGDVLCGVQPAYATIYQRLKDLDDVTLNSIPLDRCTDFELKDDLKPIEVNLILTPLQMEQLIKNCHDRAIIEQFKEYIPLYSDRELAEALRDRSTEEWIDVDSRCLSAVSYNCISHILKVRFVRGDVYQYEDVPENIFNDLLSSTSVGQYFNYYIKDVFNFSYLNE